MQREAAAQRLDPVPEPDQARAAGEVRPTAAVVADADAQHALADRHLDIRDGRVRVLGRVGQRLGHDIVGGDLGRLWQPSPHADIQADRNGRAAGQCLQRRAQPALGQDRRVQAIGDLAQLVQDAGHLGDRARQAPRQVAGLGRRRRLCGPQLQGDGYQALLGAVVQITLEPAPGGVGGGHEPRP